ncbi:MAG: hypothetical protein HYR84_15780 [Planctomycetes bacterium]|nr:hypothetical protein [Planctomycetota bacterium]
MGGCGVVTVLLSCCGGAGFGIWYFFFKGPEPDLVFVHDDALVFMSYRVADLMKSSGAKEQLTALGNEKKNSTRSSTISSPSLA